MKKVMIVEDDPVLRQKFSEYILQSREFELIAAAVTCEEADEMLSRKAPDVLLTDLGLPDGSGVWLDSFSGNIGITEVMKAIYSFLECGIPENCMARVTHHLYHTQDITSLFQTKPEAIKASCSECKLFSREIFHRVTGD